MALTAQFTSYPISGTPVSLDFHVVLEFSSAIDPTTLVGSDFRLRSQLGTFHNPSDSQVDFYTDDNITFIVVFHFTGNLGGSQQYLIRLPMNRIEYQDENDITQNGPDTTINTPLFNIQIGQEISATISFGDSEGEAGTATTATILFNQPVSGVAIDDLSVADGTLGALTVVNSGRYTVPVTPSALGDGTLTLTFAEDGTYESNAEASADLTYTGGSQTLSTPSAPLNLTATAQSNGTEVLLDWDTPSDDGGASISDYEYSSNDGGNFTAIGSTDTDYTVTGLDKNTEYDFQVRAVNSQGSGTATATVTTTTEATTPNAPTSLGVVVGETTADLSWTAPSDNGGETISSYEVSSDDGGTWTDTGDADLTYQITGLTAETEYDFKVRAVNAEGSGTASSTVTETTTAAAVALTFGTGAIADQAWEVGTAESLILPEATGGTGTITYSLSPTTPAGITFTPGTRVLAGTPTGRFALATFTYTATAGAESVDLTFTVVVTAIAITFASTVENQIYDIDTAIAVLTLPGATGGVGTLGYSLSPPLPMGLSRSNFDVSGTPTDEFALATFTWRATDSEGVSATVQFAIRVLPELADPHPVTVLPYTAALLEKALVDTYVERQADVLELEDEIPIRHLYNPDTCPVALLPYLACFISVDAPSVDFSETQLRQLIRDSYILHTRKGTIQALKDVIASLGYRLNRIEEGVASTPAVPATDWARYRLVMDTALTIESGRALQKLIVGAAPVSRELVEITYDQANSYNGVIRYDGTHAYGRIIP